MAYQNAICQLRIGDRLFGTGFLFTDDHLHILTAFHVVTQIAEYLGVRITKGLELGRVDARFMRAAHQRQIQGYVNGNQLEDWAVLSLASQVEIPSLQYVAPEREGIRARAWGYPLALDVGRPTPDHAIIKGCVEDVVAGASGFRFVVEGKDSFTGMSGAPILLDDGRWIGIVREADLNAQGEIWNGQVKACSSEPIVASCVDLPIRGSRYGVDTPATFPWPSGVENPFPGLRPLTEQHARMLHGRFRVLRRLLDKLTHGSRFSSDRLLIVTGRVGVGKSSVLRAGVIPHLRERTINGVPIDVRIAPRDSKVDLVTMLEDLARDSTAATIIIIDQVEECLIAKRGVEFAQALREVLHPSNNPDDPRSPHRVVLGLRSEFSTDLEQYLRGQPLMWNDPHILLPLKYEDIVEVLTMGGDINGARELREHLGIHIAFTDDALKRFAAELLEDEHTMIAPLLALRMSNMYELATRRSRADLSAAETRVFSDEIYTEVARNLTSIEQHLDRQLDVSLWESRLQPFVQNGLVLDILEHHTSDQATAKPRTRSALMKRYCETPSGSPFPPPCSPEQLNLIIDRMHTLRLLVDREEATDRVSTIGHDELARVSKIACQRSPDVGQRCRRLLEFRLEGAKLAKTEPGVFDDLDVQIVEAGVGGMRALLPDEVTLIQRSLAARADRAEVEEAKRKEKEETRHKLEVAALESARSAAEAAQARAEAAQSDATTAQIAASSARRSFRLSLLVFGLAGVALFVWLWGSCSRKKMAQADAMSERGSLALEDRNYNKAEVAFAQSIEFRNATSVRPSLLRARGGSMVLAHRMVASEHQREQRLGLAGVSPDGEHYAIVTKPNELELGVTANHQAIDRPAIVGEVEAFAFGPKTAEGRLVIYAASVNSIHLIHVLRLGASGPVARLGVLNDGTSAGHHAKRISTMAFNAAGTRLAVASDDGSLGLYEVTLHGAPKRVWFEQKAHTIAVHGVAFSPDGAVIASGGGDYLVKLWSVDHREGEAAIKKLEGHQDSVFGVAFDPSGTRLASGGYDRAIRIWELEPPFGSPDAFKTSRTIRILQAHRGVVETLQFSANGSMLASASKDNTVRLWDVDRARLVATLEPYVGALRSLSFVDFNRPIACAGDEGWATWNSNGRTETRKFWLDGSPINAVAFDPESRVLVAGTGSGEIWMWALGTWEPQRFEKIEGAVNGLAFSSDRRWIAAVGEGKKVHVWDRSTKIKVLERAFDGAVWGVTFDPSAKYLAIGAAAGENEGSRSVIAVWATPKEHAEWTQKTLTTPHVIYSLTATPTALVAGNANGELETYAFDPPTRLQTFRNVEFGERNVWGVASTTSWQILSANSDGIVRVWDPASGNTVASSSEPRVNPTLNSVAWNPKTRRIAAAGDGHEVVEYAIENGLVPVQRFYGQEGTVWMVAYSPDGRWLAYGGLDGFVRVIDLEAAVRLMSTPPATLLEQAEAATGLRVRGDPLRTDRDWLEPSK